MQDAHAVLPIGTVIGDRYNVIALLGKGGFGAVYLVHDQRVRSNLFALKEMIDTSKLERSRFAFECELLKRLDHLCCLVSTVPLRMRKVIAPICLWTTSRVQT